MTSRHHFRWYEKTAHLRMLGFRCARTLFYRVFIPFIVRSGPLEPVVLRAFRLLLPQRLPQIDGLPCPIDADGLTLWYDADRPSHTIRALAAGSYEQSIADLFATALRPGMTVLDVGAHIGYFSLIAAKCVGPTGRVWSFEPDPANRAGIERNLGANGMADRISVLPLAVTSAVGERSLYRVAGDTGSSTLYPSPGRDTGRDTAGEPIAVATTSLDEWANSRGWPPVDLVKVDAEGAEGAILAGMTELLRRNPGIVVVLEFQADALEAADQDPAELLERLLDMTGRRIEVLGDRGGRDLTPRETTALVRRSRWSPLNLAIRASSPAPLAIVGDSGASPTTVADVRP